MSIVEKIAKIPNLYVGTGCTLQQLIDAQKELGVGFPKEFVDYVLNYGDISFYSTELTGLNLIGESNVVTATQLEREVNKSFPVDYFVIENLGMDGLIAASNQKGEVYAVQGEYITKLCNSLSEYLDLCILRSNASN